MSVYQKLIRLATRLENNLGRVHALENALAVW